MEFEFFLRSVENTEIEDSSESIPTHLLDKVAVHLPSFEKCSELEL